MTQQPQPPENLSVLRNIKIGTFHVGSAMADVLGAGVWNRVMIEDLGYAATPVGLLLALRYFLAPLAAWAGQRSDVTDFRGYRRLPWVWGGRLGMIIGYLLVAFSTVELIRSGSAWWAGIVLGFVIASIGYSISGSTFLALVYDRAPREERGRAIGIVWTFLLAGFAIAGVLFSRLLPEYSEDAFLTFFVTASLLMVAIWIFALWGEEKRHPATNPSAAQPPQLPMLSEIRALWTKPSARMLAFFMMLSFVAAFMQDSLLEPFGGHVFDLSVGETTRFQAYWGTMSIVSSIGALWAHRRFSTQTYQHLTRYGVWVMILTFILLSSTAWTATESLLRPVLLLLGVGYGLWNIGTLGLMVDNSREEKAGFDLGVWTVVVTLCRGGGVFLGAILFDISDALLGDGAAAYGTIFALEAVLLVVALAVLNQIAVQATTPEMDGELILSTSLD